MADLINLRSVRKAKARAQKETLAAANRELHGRTKADRTRLKAELMRAQKTLDGARLDQGPPGASAQEDDPSGPC